MSAFVINRNNEISSWLPELKKKFRTGNNTTAVYKAIEDYVFMLPEIERLKTAEKELAELKKALSQRETVDNMLKKFILREAISETK